MLLEEYYFLGKNAKLSPKWSGPHEIISLKGTHNVELLMNKKKKVIVSVDRIKPYCLPTTMVLPDEEEEVFTRTDQAPAQAPVLLQRPGKEETIHPTQPFTYEDKEVSPRPLIRKRGRPSKSRSPLDNPDATTTVSPRHNK